MLIQGHQPDQQNSKSDASRHRGRRGVGQEQLQDDDYHAPYDDEKESKHTQVQKKEAKAVGGQQGSKKIAKGNQKQIQQHISGGDQLSQPVKVSNKAPVFRIQHIGKRLCECVHD